MDPYLEKMARDGALLGYHPRCNELLTSHDEGFYDEDEFEDGETSEDTRTPAQYAQDEVQRELVAGTIQESQVPLRLAQIEAARAFNPNSKWLRGDGGKRVADPYWVNVAIPASSPSGKLFAFNMIFAAVSLFLTIATIVAGIPAFGAPSWLYVMWSVYCHRRNKNANAVRAEKLAEKLARQTYQASGNAYWQLKTISDGIAACDEEQQAELRPLWDAALEAANVLDREDSAVAIASLNARAYAVQELRRVEDELAEAERVAALSTSERALAATPDSSDLAAIRMMTESRRAGVEAYKSMAGEA